MESSTVTSTDQSESRHGLCTDVIHRKCDSLGRLTSLLSDVEMWGQWLAEADLYPETDGTVGPVKVKYYSSRNRDRIQRPEDSQEYEVELSKVPVYMTIRSLPCASMLKEAEKMNATQE